MATLAMIVGGVNCAWAQASYNHTYTEGVEVTTGYDYFLYNIGSGTFLTGGMDWGSRLSGDHAGKTVEFRAVNDGVYKIWTYYYSNNTLSNDGWLGTNSFMDAAEDTQAECVFTPVNVSGYINAYKIQNTRDQNSVLNKYLRYNADDTRVNWVDNADDNYAYWLIIPKASRDAVGDYTYYIPNQGINRPWERQVWCGFDWQQNNRGDWKTWDNNGWSNHPYYTVGGNDNNPCGEKFCQIYDFYQTIVRELPEGRYRLYAQAFWRDGSSGESYLYMGDAQHPLVQFNANGENTKESMTGASTAFSAGQYVNSVEKFLSTSATNVRIGINMTTANQWVIFDNFYLEYLGQCVMDYAVALPEGGAMEANKWYYFDVTTAADNYLATATTLADIICTTDGYTLTSATSGNVTLTAQDNSFSATRYYVKSSSANSLEISVANYTYTINDPTISTSYVQEGNTVTVSFTTSTNDPAPELTQDYSGVTFGGNAIEVTQTESGFTFTVPEVTANTKYMLSIPAGAISFNEDNGNAAKEFELNTPVVLDGNYYLYNPYTKKFLSRGHSYGTAAVADIYGVPFNLITDGEGKSIIKFVDNDKYLFNTYWLFADGASPDKFVISAQNIGEYSGYAFFNQNLETNNRLYVYVNEGNGDNYRVAGNAIIGDNCANEAQTVWQIKTVEEHNAIVNAYPTENIRNVIMTSDISTTVDNFNTYMSENYVETDMTSVLGTSSFGSDAGDWTWTQVRGEDGWPKYTDGYARLYQATGSFTQTISADKLPAGIYKVTMAGFDRRGANSVDEALATTYGSVSSSYLVANDQQVRMKSWKEMFDNAGKSDSWEGQKNSMDGGFADNELYIYLDGSTDLTLTIAKPNYCSVSYMCFGNFKLTRYETLDNAKEELAAAINAAEANLGFETGEYAPYNNVDALQTLAAAKAINVDEASGADIVAATTALTKATWTANTEEVNAIVGNKTFAQGSYTNKDTYDLPNGWSNSGYNTRIMGINEGTNNKGLQDEDGTVVRHAMLVKYSTSYGESEGYTLPLKPETMYEFSFDYGLWNEGGAITKNLTVTDPDGKTINMIPSTVSGNEGSKEACANAVNTAWHSYKAWFKTTTAGNYVLNIVNADGNNQRQMAFSSLELKKAVAEAVTMDETVAYTPAYTYANVTLNRNFTADVWNTFCVPFDIDNATLKAQFGDEVAVSAATLTAEAVTFTPMNEPAITANTPVIIKVPKASISEFTFNGVMIKTGEAKVTGTNAEFVGNYAGKITLPAKNCYYIAQNKLKKTTGTQTMKGFRAYFTTVSGARLSMIIDGEDTTTSIDGVEVAPLMEGSVYNLNGQRVDKAQKGLYIVNGKKVVVK